MTARHYTKTQKSKVFVGFSKFYIPPLKTPNTIRSIVLETKNKA
jgi:hypothetical protein